MVCNVNRGENWPDYYEVMIAPNGSTNISDFVQIFSEDAPEDWEERTADISAYAGTTVRVVFHHQDYAQYWVILDNFGVTVEGGEITSMKFYTNPAQAYNIQNISGPTYAGYMTEVSSETISEFIDFNSATNIFNGNISLTDDCLIINFTTPYTYNGGNLAIAFLCTTSAGYCTVHCYSAAVDGGSIYRNSEAANAVVQNYIPKTTFYYTPEVIEYTVNMHVNGVVTEGTIRAGSTLQAPENIPAGLTFCGWTTADIDTYTDVAPANQTKVTEVSDLYAVFSYTEEIPVAKGEETWVEVTSSSDLSSGDQVIFVEKINSKA